jgi:phosphotransferase system enzyme I (PtsI)
MMILQDPEWMKDIKEKISGDTHYTPEYAVHESAEATASMFEAMDNAYFKERAHDIRDVARRIIRILRGEKAVNLSAARPGTIVAAEDLTPSDTAQLKPENIVGIITAIGGKTSHSAIIARTLGIPAVMGIGKDAFEALESGDTAVVDGYEGTLSLGPDQTEVQDVKVRIEKYAVEREALKALVGKTSVTADGKTLEIASNIASPGDLKRVLENDSEGVGLFRSEFLFMDRTSAPDEEEQFQAYKAVLEGLGERPVIIRTMDIGGDKEVPYLGMPEEMNPFLGYRAIRYCLEEPEIFRVQIRALLRAGVYGNLKIMLPMVSGVSELRQAKAIIDSVKDELRDEDVSFNASVPLGIMIEIPAAAIASDLLAKEVDFFSIGTNDLIQYTVAVDRMNENIASLYTAYHPAVLRLIRMTIENGHKAGIWVGMCGSVAGDLDLMPLLIGMGLDEFSMSPSNVLKARKRALEINQSEAFERLDELLALPTAKDIENRLKALYPR